MRALGLDRLPSLFFFDNTVRWLTTRQKENCFAEPVSWRFLWDAITLSAHKTDEFTLTKDHISHAGFSVDSTR